MTAANYSDDVFSKSRAALPAKTHDANEIPSRQAFAPRVTRLNQSIDLRQNHTSTLIAALSALVICALIAGLWMGRLAKSESVRGMVATTGGYSRFTAPRKGIVKNILVKQGDDVVAGQPIFSLRITEASSGGETAEASEMRNLDQTRANYVQDAKRAADFIAQVNSERQSLSKDMASLLAALDDQEQSIANALAQTTTRLQKLRFYVEHGYATRDVLEAQQRTAFEYERQLSEIRLKRVEYKRQEEEKRRTVMELIAEKESQQAAAENQIRAVDTRIARLRTETALEVRAESAGRILTVAAKPGDTVDVDQLIAAVGDPNAQPLIVLDAPARAIGLAKIGQRVVLKYDAFPFKTFGIHGGVITSISAASVRGPGLDDPKDPTGLDPRPVERQSLYRIEVRPDENEVEAYGEKHALKFGSTLSADIVVEKRRLIDWVLDPIRAMRGRV